MYELTISGVYKKDTSTWIAENGKGWQEYQEWLAEGNTPEPQYTPEELAANEALELKINAIIDARNASGIKNVTIEQAYAFIDNKLDSAGTATEKVEAIRDILKKMVPFLLN